MVDSSFEVQLTWPEGPPDNSHAREGVDTGRNKNKSVEGATVSTQAIDCRSFGPGPRLVSFPRPNGRGF